MNRICGTCGGYIGNFTIAGDVEVKICNCMPNPKKEQECNKYCVGDGNTTYPAFNGIDAIAESKKSKNFEKYSYAASQKIKLSIKVYNKTEKIRKLLKEIDNLLN